MKDIESWYETQITGNSDMKLIQRYARRDYCTYLEWEYIEFLAAIVGATTNVTF